MRNFKLCYLFSVSLLFIAFSSFSQDTILKFNGESIRAKITEISTTEVKYKKFDFQDGPLYILDKSEVKMIRYSNGLKEEFKKVQHTTANAVPIITDNKITTWGPFYRIKEHTVNESFIRNVLLETHDKQITGLVIQAKEAQRMQYIGFIAIPLGIAGLVSYYGAMTRNYNLSGTGISSPNDNLLLLSGVCLIGTISCPVISGIYKQKRTNCYRSAIKIYNEKF